jgi:hypothetical protein
MGRTKDFNRRMNEFSFDTQIISVCPIDNEKKCECELIREFKSEFEFRPDIEKEHFEGNEMKMISVFKDYCSDHLLNKEEDIDMDFHCQNEDQRFAAERNQRQCKKC